MNPSLFVYLTCLTQVSVESSFEHLTSENAIPMIQRTAKIENPAIMLIISCPCSDAVISILPM